MDKYIFNKSYNSYYFHKLLYLDTLVFVPIKSFLIKQDLSQKNLHRSLSFLPTLQGKKIIISSFTISKGLKKKN